MPAANRRQHRRTIADAVRWAERIMNEIDRRHPVKPIWSRTIKVKIPSASSGVA